MYIVASSYVGEADIHMKLGQAKGLQGPSNWQLHKTELITTWVLSYFYTTLSVWNSSQSEVCEQGQTGRKYTPRSNCVGAGWLKSVVQVFYKAHTFLLAIDIISSHWKLVFHLPNPQPVWCFVLSAGPCLGQGTHDSFTQGLSCGHCRPSSSSPMHLPSECQQSAAKGIISLDPSHSYPLTWQELCRRLLGTFSACKLFSKTYIPSFFFFFWNSLCPILPWSGHSKAEGVRWWWEKQRPIISSASMDSPVQIHFY